MLKKTVNCFKCKHFYITWDPSHPKGCRLFGFKTMKLPSDSVLEASGKECEGFEAKDQLKK